jgi:hypothetical protein
MEPNFFREILKYKYLKEDSLERKLQENIREKNHYKNIGINKSLNDSEEDIDLDLEGQVLQDRGEEEESTVAQDQDRDPIEESINLEKTAPDLKAGMIEFYKEKERSILRDRKNDRKYEAEHLSTQNFFQISKLNSSKFSVSNKLKNFLVKLIIQIMNIIFHQNYVFKQTKFSNNHLISNKSENKKFISNLLLSQYFKYFEFI